MPFVFAIEVTKERRRELEIECLVVVTGGVECVEVVKSHKRRWIVAQIEI